MGAARHTQRHQEQAQRRVARNGPHIIGPAPGWKPAGIKYERSGLTYDDIAALLDGTIAREKALEAERDRLREERDAMVRAAAKAGDVIEQVMTERERLRAALDELREYVVHRHTYESQLDYWRVADFCQRALDILDRHGFGGER